MAEYQSAEQIVAELMSTVQFRQPVGVIQKVRAGTPDAKPRASNTKLKATIARYGLRKKVDPLGSFMELIYEAAGNVDYLRTEVNKLNSMFVRGRAEQQEIAAYVRLYNDERDRLEKYLKDAARIGLEQRTVKLLEMQAQLIVGVVQGVVDGLDLTPEQRATALKIAADALRSLQPNPGCFRATVDEGQVAS